MKALLIYYGYPSLINGSKTKQDSLEHFRNYAQVVLGDGLQNASHPDHAHSKWLIANLSSTLFFGYIDLGVYSPHHPMQNLSLVEIGKRAADWKDLGVAGILLDDYGYDFAVTRERQKMAVETLHQLGLRVIANSWDPRHALDSAPCEGNPKGLPAPLKSGDFYLYESYMINNGEWTHFKQWRAKSNTLARLRKSQREIEILSTTTTRPGVHLTQADLEFVYHCAWMEGHQGFAWGEPHFAAGDNQAPWRTRPQMLSPVTPSKIRPAPGETIQCLTTEGRAIADFSKKTIYLDPRKSWWQKFLRWTNK